MAEKVTVMILKVDLQCPYCYKKVKKILCKFPEIREQVYDEKQNLVKIKVICCSPEKIRDKLCCKGGKVIKSIEIVEPPKTGPKPSGDKDHQKKEPSSEKPGKNSKPGTESDPPENSKPGSAPPPIVIPPPHGYCCVPCSEGYGGGPCYYGYGRPVPPPPCYDNYWYWYGYGKGCYVRRCDYFSEESTGGCSIM